MGLTFSEVAIRILRHRRSNPRYANEWSTDLETIERELDEYNCLRLKNDKNYCTGAPPNFQKESGSPNPSFHQSRGAKVAADAAELAVGAMTIADWLGSGGNPVSRELAESRAAICVGCKFNSKGDWKRFFTIGTSRAITSLMSLAKGRKIETSHDGELKVCEICSCPMRLKCHVPIEHIKSELPDETLKAFPEWCWQKKEIESL